MARLLSCGTMLGAALSLNAAVIAVSPGSAVQTAINSARSGDTVQVAAGTYAENLTIDSKRVVLLGGYAAGFGSRDIAVNVTTIQGGASSPVVQLQGDRASGSVIDGFTIRGGRQGITFPSWPPLRNVTVSNNIIRNNGTTSVEGGGIALSGAGNVVSHNVFYGNVASKGAAIAGGDSCLIQYNLVDSNTGHADHGGGIYLHGHPTLSHNIIRRNRTGVTAGYGWGGGGIIFGNYTSARSARGSMSYDIIYGNSAPSHGGGFFVDDGAMVALDHELFFNNSADDGGGLYVDGGAPSCTTYVTLTNCTIVNNRSSGIILDGVAPSAARVAVTNSIVWGNELLTQIEDGNTLTAAYCIVQSAWPGAGNIVADPLFADTAGHDFHAKSSAGRWSPDLTTWVNDAVSSPAIDAGDPASDWSAEPAPNGSRVNLGCYGGTAEASKSGGSSTVDQNNAFSEYFRFRCLPDPGRRGFLISFALPFTQPMTLTVHDAAGREMARLLERPLSSGEYAAVWDSRGVAPAVYALRLRAGDMVVSREVVLVK